MPHSMVAAAFLLAHLPALATDSAVITDIDQRPWIINAGGVLKSETELTIENHRGQAVDAWVKAGEALDATKATLSWQPSTDIHAVAGYQVFRDGTRIADLSAVFNSWMDDAVKRGTTYRYTVKARDLAGNLSPDCGPAAVTTLP